MTARSFSLYSPVPPVAKDFRRQAAKLDAIARSTLPHFALCDYDMKIIRQHP
jgi:hypothetical protein